MVPCTPARCRQTKTMVDYTSCMHTIITGTGLNMRGFEMRRWRNLTSTVDSRSACTSRGTSCSVISRGIRWFWLVTLQRKRDTEYRQQHKILKCCRWSSGTFVSRRSMHAASCFFYVSGWAPTRSIASVRTFHSSSGSTLRTQILPAPPFAPRCTALDCRRHSTSSRTVDWQVTFELLSRVCDDFKK